MSANIRPLEYSEEVLAKRIVWVKLKNIQGIKDIEFNIPPSGIVRLNASSETGKSSAFRPFESLVTDKYNSKRDIESLVTKGETYGELLVRQVNGTFIGLHLDCTKTTNCFYIIQRPGDKPERLHYPLGLPNVLEELGWYTTGLKKQDFSINVRLKGELPIIDSSKRLNTELFNVALNDDVLESTHHSLKQSVAESNNTTSNLQSELGSLRYSIQALSVEDESALERELDMLTNLQECDTACDVLTSCITDLYVNLQRKPTHVVAPRQTVPLFDTVDTLVKLGGSLDTLCTLQRPQYFSVDKGVATNISTLTILGNMLNSLENIHKKPKKVTCDRSVSSKLATLDVLDRQLKHLSQLQRIEKVSKPRVSHRDVGKELIDLTNVDRLVRSLSELETSVSHRVHDDVTEIRCNKLLHHLEFLVNIAPVGEIFRSRIQSIQDEKSKYQCPTCGQYASTLHKHVKEETNV